MYKGIECVFSEKAEAILSSDDLKIFLLDSFFTYEPIDSIRWVNVKEATDDEQLPMYRISNNANQSLLLWPTLNGSDLLLAVDSVEDRPDLGWIKNKN